MTPVKTLLFIALAVACVSTVLGRYGSADENDKRTSRRGRGSTSPATTGYDWNNARQSYDTRNGAHGTKVDSQHSPFIRTNQNTNKCDVSGTRTSPTSKNRQNNKRSPSSSYNNRNSGTYGSSRSKSPSSSRSKSPSSSYNNRNSGTYGSSRSKSPSSSYNNRNSGTYGSSRSKSPSSSYNSRNSGTYGSSRSKSPSSSYNNRNSGTYGSSGRKTSYGYESNQGRRYKRDVDFESQIESREADNVEASDDDESSP